MSWRRAVILMVVLSLLALFAIVGLTAVLYAQNSAKASSNFAKAWQLGFVGSPGSGAVGGVGGAVGGAVGGQLGVGGPGGVPVTFPIAPIDLFRWAYGQLIYDVDDATGALSSIRGHSLARTMYGFNDGSLNLQPFNGMGRISSVYQNGPYNGIDDRYMINYTYVPGLPLRDPEHVGMRSDTVDMANNPVPAYMTARGPFVGGANPPVTYPNLDNMYLAASRADGTNLTPSLHRPWLFGPLFSGVNPNWSNAQGRFMTLRPRPADNLVSYSQINPADTRVGFPYPPEDGGDVKNRLGYPGGNDSIWVDFNYPVQQLGDGRRYKPLFAFYVQDLDGRVNLNTAGNLMGGLAPNEVHVSNQGWGKWETNIMRVLNRADSPQALTEWQNLFVGNANVPFIPGRYGQPLPGNFDRYPWVPKSSWGGGKQARFLAQVDYRPSDETSNYGPTPLLQFAPASPFPLFPPAYDSGSAPANFAHAKLFDYFQPRGPWNQFPPTNDSVFPITDIKPMIVNGFTGQQATSANVVQLCPLNFSLDAVGQRRRNLVTLLSMDMNRLGVAPWLYSPQVRNNTGYASPANAEAAPFGPQVQSVFTDANGNNLPRNAIEAVLEKVDLDQPLRQYPHTDRNIVGNLPNGYNGRFDWDPANLPGIAQTYLDAQSDRQNMAGDIFKRLLIATGTPSPADPTQPTDAELIPIRWMAQLAANIVDFIDEDEISTPFNFYPVAYQYYSGLSPTAQQMGGPTGFVGAVSTTNANGDRLPRYWVFGTELPPVLLTEVFTEYALPTDAKGNISNGQFFPKVWAELYNPFPTTVPASVQQQDTGPMALYIAKGDKLTVPYSAYQMVVANSNANGSLLPRPTQGDNVLGIAEQVRSSATFDKPTTPTVDTTATPATAVSPQQGNGFFIVGPSSNTRGNSISVANGRTIGGVPWYQSPTGMTWAVNYTSTTDNWNIDDRTKGVTVLLRRLANPHMPPQDDPGLPFYNPYLTMDYIEQVALNNVTSPTQDKAAAYGVGKKQPYAAERSTQINNQSFAGDALNQHTLGQLNSNDGARNWLVHMDRQVISPYELLNVSGYRQHMLTQKFITNGTPYSHRVPWFDEDLQGGMIPQSHRLYRLFAYIETSDQAAGISLRGRRPGLINLNTVWDYEIFAALCDAKAKADPARSNSFTEDDVIQAWRAILSRRNPDLVLNANPAIPDFSLPASGVGLTQNDRPIFDPGAGFIPSGDPAAPNGRSLEDTIFQRQDPTGMATNLRLLQTNPPSGHPYQQYELLTKIGTGFTLRSNTFAIWLTTGYFEVVDHPVTKLPVLGEEIGRSTGTEVRHRFFAVVDRTQLVLAPGLTLQSNLTPGIGSSTQPQWVTLIPSNNLTGVGGLSGWITYNNGSGTQIPWSIVPGSIIVINRGGSDEETVVVTAIDNSNPMAPKFQAIFRRDHTLGFGNPPIGITIPGNPGPKPNWSPTDPMENLVVPYWEYLGPG
jgi:hypothetical protein